LLPLEDTHPGSTKAVYDHAFQLFLHGNLIESQQEATEEAIRFQRVDPAWASRFQLLEAETMLYRGLYDPALQLLAAWQPVSGEQEGIVKKFAIEAVAFTRQRETSKASDNLTQAEAICNRADYAACGDVLRGRGILASALGNQVEASRFFQKTFDFARAHHDRFLEASASTNLGYTAIQSEHLDEAVDWLQSAYRASMEIGAENWAQNALGNLGWAYYRQGDYERALQLFLEAEKRATIAGNLRTQMSWASSAANVYGDSGDHPRAIQAFEQVLNLATQLDNKERVSYALGGLAYESIMNGKPDDAKAYIDRFATMLHPGGSRDEELLVLLVQGKIAALTRQDKQAEAFFHTIEQDPQTRVQLRMISEDELAKLFETEGKADAADRMYKTALNSFENGRARLKSEDSRLSFIHNAASLYDDYVHLLVKEGRSDEALAVADRSRARTLEQGLGTDLATTSFQMTAFNPRQLAKKTGATLLFYWLDPKQSYLWAITPGKISLITLPPAAEITTRVERYRKAILDLQDPLQSSNQDGIELYKLLVAPASAFIHANTPVVILAEDELNHLNFETLLAPGPSPNRAQGSSSRANSHYWIEDATLLSAPSLATLAAAKPTRNVVRNLLLFGNPVSPSQDFPSLPLFGFEMTRIERHFSPRDQAVFAGQQANPEAYLAGNPARYSYIHFVSHAVASQTDPLDSAIILSPTTASGNSFKLYARDIMQHPIDARLVTISACNGSGTRSYAGEGLVGLSWAFLHAGAHSVIGALWEVSDDSTPRLMDTLYQGLQDGLTPAAALRQAKLSLLYSHAASHIPYYWAPFQIYTRQ
jgi:CHAT domain-containing protein/outer membrane protein assembly factor BamD (BamD/ComL family)